jgi:formamidopyrimidine-DNA glycosylase
MPELPEVQTVVNDLIASQLIGRRIAQIAVHWDRTIADPAPARFRQELVGSTIRAIRRRAKYIVIELGPRKFWLIHLRMTGRLQVSTAGEPADRHDHVIIILDDGRQVRFHDTRKFGRMWLVCDPGEVLGSIGPEPLDDSFTAADLGTLIRTRHRQLKPLLLDQTFIAGLGNIYVDEALWEARLDPRRDAGSLTNAEIGRLHAAIRKVLTKGIANQGTTLGTGQSNFYSVGRRSGRNRATLKVFRRTGKPCPRCKAAIRRIVVGQRSTHVCVECQK